MSLLLVQGNTLYIPLADKSVHCIVTSPPYWGLRAYATGDNKHVELGSEPLHDCLGWATGADCGECYICHMRQVARECWRVLRDDGVMFWNVADSYATGTTAGRQEGTLNLGNGTNDARQIARCGTPAGLKTKDKCGIPERTALAFQADGWYWRSGITWVKPNPMPESVLDRPTKSTEMIYLFTKSERYYYDAEAVREAHVRLWDKSNGGNLSPDGDHKANGIIREMGGNYPLPNPAGRNLRDAWTIATQNYAGAHYATFPPELPRRCVKAGTSERGACGQCGAPWRRVVETESHSTPVDERIGRQSHNGRPPQQSGWFWTPPHKKDERWEPTCKHYSFNDAISGRCPPIVPCIVLDPFSGAATTGLVARELGRHYIGLELSGEYLKQSRERLGLAALDAWKGGNGNEKATSLEGLPMFVERSEP